MSVYTVTLSETSLNPVTLSDGTSFAVLQVAAGRGPKGDGWTGVTYDTQTGRFTFTSNDGLGYVSDDITVGLDAAVAAAEAAQTAAEAAEANTISLFDQFGDQYLGPKASDPTVDNDGDPLTDGDIYFNTTDNVLKFYTGTAWVAPEAIATTAASDAQAAQAAAEAAQTAAETAETNASSSATAAATSAADAAASYDSFDDRYLGAKASAPTVDNDGDPLLTGAIYWNTTVNQLYVWSGSAWDEAAFNISNLVLNNGDTTLTGDYSTSGSIAAGRGSGGVALTVNDGQGDANVTFNHQGGVAEQAGNVGRITVNADSTTGASMSFDITSNASAGAVTSVTYMTLTETSLTVNGDINSTSDAKHKTNVETILNPIDKVMSLRGVNFDWTKSGSKSMGVIAQEVEEIIPEVVSSSEEGKSVNYSAMVGLLIEAIKDQQKQIQNLEARLNLKT